MSSTLSIAPTAKVSTQGERPNPADRQYLDIKEHALGSSPEYFNGETGRNLRSLEIHGVTVRLSGKEGERLAVYNGAKNIKKFVVWADTVQVEGPYVLHGCEVEINARVLKGAGGSLTTTAQSTQIPLIGNSANPTNKAVDGQAGGSVKLNIYGANDSDSNLPPITANGSAAQQIARFRTQSDNVELLKISLNDAGQQVAAFYRSPFRDEALAKALRDPKIAGGSESWRRADLSQDWEYFQWPELHKSADGKSALGNITYVEVTLPPPPSGTRWNTGPYLLGRPEGPWTDDASKYPAVGAGGPGGMVQSTIAVRSYLLTLQGGMSSAVVEPAQQPSLAIHLKMVLGNPRQPNQPATASFDKKQKKPPNRPTSVRAKEGSYSPIAKSAKPSEHQLSLMYKYAKDCYREGYFDDARSFLDRLPAASTEQSAQVQEQLADAAILKSRLASGLDFYGNPPNWVPLLAVETNVGLFHGEIDHGINSLYLAHLILSRWQDQDDRIQIVNEALEEARKVIAEHQKSMLDAVSAAGNLVGKVNMLTQQADAFKTQLTTLHDELEVEAKNRVNQQASWEQFQSVLKFLGAFASVIPVGQPYLGMGVTAIDAVLATTIDPTKSPNEKIARLFEQTSTGLKKVTSDEETKAAFGSLLADYSDMEPLYQRGKDLVREKKQLEKKVTNPDKLALQRKKEEITAHKNKISAASRKKQAEATAITKMAAGLGDAAAATASLIKTLQVDKEEMEAKYATMLAQLKQDSSKFQGIKAAFDLLSQRKEELLGQMLAEQRKVIQAAADRATAVARLETLLHEREKEVTVLNPDVKSFAERLQRDSVDALRKYYYFLIRSWEYCFLEPAPKAFDPSDLTNKTLQFLQGNDESVTLTPEQFEQLKTIYMGILSALGKRLVEKLQSEMPRLETDQDVTLGETELSILNTAIEVPSSQGATQTAKMRKVTINFEKLGRMPALTDDLRIANIDLHPVLSAVLQKPMPENIVLRLWHSGKSVIVRDGNRYDFVSSGPKARMMWGVTYHSLNKTRTPIAIADKDSAAVLSGLFGDKVSQIRRYSPSYLGDLELVVLSDPADREFRFDGLRLKVTYEHRAL